MSEYQRILNESKNPANWQDTPDPAAVAAVDAFRAAIVAQTALLRELSQQVRMGFEGLKAIETVQDAIRFEAEQDRKEAMDQIHISRHETIKYFDSQAAGLAERLDKQAEGRSVANSLTIGSLNAIEGRLAAIEAKLAPQPTVHEKRIDYGEHCNCRSCKEYRASQSKQNQSLTRKKSKHGKAKR